LKQNEQDLKVIQESYKMENQMQKIRFFILLFSFILMACEKDPVGSEKGGPRLAMKAQYITSTLGEKTTGALNNALAVEAITITRARFLVRNINLRSVPEDSMEFVSDPYIIDLNLDGLPNTIAVEEIPADTYDRIDYRIHRLDDDDPRDLAYFQHPDFQDFVADDRYSIIIEGTVQEGVNRSESFVFRSRDNEKQRHFLNPYLIVGESLSQITVVFEFNGTNWFKSENGTLLDPRDESFEKEISDNLKQSIEIKEKKIDDESNNDDIY